MLLTLNKLQDQLIHHQKIPFNQMLKQYLPNHTVIQPSQAIQALKNKMPEVRKQSQSKVDLEVRHLAIILMEEEVYQSTLTELPLTIALRPLQEVQHQEALLTEIYKPVDQLQPKDHHREVLLHMQLLELVHQDQLGQLQQAL